MMFKERLVGLTLQMAQVAASKVRTVIVLQMVQVAASKTRTGFTLQMAQVGASRVKTKTYGLQGNGNENDEHQHAWHMNFMMMIYDAFR